MAIGGEHVAGRNVGKWKYLGIHLVTFTEGEDICTLCDLGVLLQGIFNTKRNIKSFYSIGMSMEG